MSFILMFTLQCFFPIFDLAARESTGISIVNPDSESREFTVTATTPDGTSRQTARVTLGARGQRAQLLREILGTATAPASGWIRVDSSTAGCRIYLTSQTEQNLTGTDAGSTSTTVLLPRISVNTGFTELSHTDTQIALVNPNDAAANVTAQLIGIDGGARGSITMIVAAQGSRTFLISEAFQNVLPGNTLGGKTFEGSLRLSSDVAVAAWLRIERPLSKSILRGRGVADINPTNLAIIPHFVFGGSYESVVNVVNPTTAAMNLELTAFDDRGRRMGEVTQIALSARESRRASVPDLFRMALPAIFPLPVFSGYVRIREAQSQVFQIAGDVQITSSGAAPVVASMLYPITDTGSTIWTAPFAVSSSSYFTGYAIVNPNELLTVQTDIQLEVISSTGAVVSQTAIQLSPLNRQAALIAPGLSNGYLRFTSNFPVHVMGAIGTEDLRLLDQLPALR
jgi:hypothetical protein